MLEYISLHQQSFSIRFFKNKVLYKVFFAWLFEGRVRELLMSPTFAHLERVLTKTTYQRCRNIGALESDWSSKT